MQEQVYPEGLQRGRGPKLEQGKIVRGKEELATTPHSSSPCAAWDRGRQGAVYESMKLNLRKRGGQEGKVLF